MGMSDALHALNVAIAERETAGDKDWFAALLAPEFTMRRASGACVNRHEFLDAVGPSANRKTTGVTGEEVELAASAMCVVSMEQPDGSWKSFRNYRAFVRTDTAAAWQLLTWANEPTGPQVNIVGKVALEFTGESKTLKNLHNLSAIQRDGDCLWLASDELTTLERLTRVTDAAGEAAGTAGDEEGYGDHRSFPLGDLGVTLPAGNDEEIDIEGLDLANGYLWLVGSHSSTRKNLEPDADANALEEFAEIRERPNRHLLVRIALARDGNGFSPVAETTPGASEERRTTAALVGDLAKALLADDHLAPFLAIPAKENGLDVEGLAVFGDRVLLGLRGPVLRGWATVLEVEPRDHPNKPARLTLGSPPYRKHFLDLDGLGVRDLCRDGDDLLVLAGPTMGLDGPVRVYRWRGAANGRDQEIVAGSDLSVAVELPFGNGDDHAEAITVISPEGEPVRLLVVYDSPSAGRLKEGDGELTMVADLTAPLP